MTPMKILLAAAAIAVAAPAFAQEDLAPELQCLRYLQSYERSMQIPQGLLTAISYVEAGRASGPNNELTAWRPDVDSAAAELSALEARLLLLPPGLAAAPRVGVGGPAGAGAGAASGMNVAFTPEALAALPRRDWIPTRSWSICAPIVPQKSAEVALLTLVDEVLPVAPPPAPMDAAMVDASEEELADEVAVRLTFRTSMRYCSR